MQAHLPWGQRAKKKLFARSNGSPRVRDGGREEEVPRAGTTAMKKQATMAIAYSFYYYN